MASVAVAGSIAQRPGYGGHAWALLQYALGLQRLGFDVLFIDRLSPEMHMTPAPVPKERECVEWFLQLMRLAGLQDNCALLMPDRKNDIGLKRQQLLDRVAQSELLLNVSGFISDREILEVATRRVFLDIDPGFPHMWRKLKLADTFRGHDDFVTVAQNIGSGDCRIPACGFDWVTTAPPVDIDAWSITTGSRGFTTVASWRGPYDPIEYCGHRYGLRVHEFRKFARLPQLTKCRFEAALEIDDSDQHDIELLRSGGWKLVDPVDRAGTPERYQRYVADSSAEIMVAKQMYVETRSGWFSDRSACYLASGKPVLAQDTGFSRAYPVGAGLLSFTDLDSAVDGVHEISGNYQRHARAAREVAEEYFDARKVLARLLAALGVA